MPALEQEDRLLVVVVDSENASRIELWKSCLPAQSRLYAVEGFEVSHR